MRLRATAMVLAAGLLCALPAAAQKVSRPGEYSGYAQAAYDGHQRTSFYVPMRDGTRLAVGSTEESSILLYDLASREQVAELDVPAH